MCCVDPKALHNNRAARKGRVEANQSNNGDRQVGRQQQDKLAKDKGLCVGIYIVVLKRDRCDWMRE